MKREPIFLREPIVFDKQGSCPFDVPYGYIYKYTNKINGHYYIGKHTFDKPEIDKTYWGSGTEHLQNAYDKYGKENFDREILLWLGDGTDEELHNQLNIFEIEFIDAFHAYENPVHYNETPGGDGVSSDALKKLWESHPERREYYSKLYSGKGNPMFGNGHKVSGSKNGRYKKEVSSSTREKISISLKNSWTKEKRDKQSKLASTRTGEKNSNYGNKWSDEKKKEQSKIVSEKMSNPEVRKRLSEFASTRTGEKNPNYGNKWSDEKRKNCKSSKPVVQLSKENEFIEEFYSISYASEIVGVSGTCIRDCCSGNQKTAGGFKWMYKYEYEEMKQCQ